MLTEQIKKELVARITATEKVDKILLFGSQATRNSGPNSDIDLAGFLDDETLPHSFKERSTNFLHVSKVIRDIEKIYPIDLLVYTKPEFEMIEQRENLFIRRLLKDAIELT